VVNSNQEGDGLVTIDPIALKAPFIDHINHKSGLLKWAYDSLLK